MKRLSVFALILSSIFILFIYNSNIVTQEIRVINDIILILIDEIIYIKFDIALVYKY